jgi:uncharacterized repeat protein (TIGR01451 family)
MKKIIYTILPLIYFFTLAETYAQCGVTSVIYGTGSTNAITYDANQSVFSSGWVPYDYAWKINENYIFQPQAQTPPIIMYEGANQLCLTVFATNPSTGDSCSDTHCNIFQTTGYNVYTNLSAKPNTIDPMSIDYQIDFVGGPPSCISSFSINFGDGNSSTLQSGTHQYSTPGDYTIQANADCSGWSSSQNRKIHVNNGNSDIAINPISPNYACDSISLTVTSPSNIAYAQVRYLNEDPVPVPITMNTPFGHKFNVPGQSVMEIGLADTTNNTYTTLYQYHSVFINECGINPDTASGTVWYDADADGIWDTTESPLYHKQISIDNYWSFTDSNGFYKLLIPDQSVTLTPLGVVSNAVTFPGSGNYTFHFHNGTLHPGYDFGFSDLNVNICGKVFVDQNLDNIFTSSTDIPYQKVTIKAFNSILNKSFYTVSDVSGNYCIVLPSGNYIVEAISTNLDSAYSVPDTFMINSTGGNYLNKNFAFNSNLQGCNTQVNIWSGNPRPGFSIPYSINVFNSGIDSAQSDLVFHYDPLLILNNSGGGIADTINHTITWHTPILPATGYIYYNVTFTLSSNTPLGTAITNSAVLTSLSCTDYDLINNSCTVINQAVGSFDPNDKIVTPQGFGVNGDIHHDQRLYYRINFQNTGTASAKNVFVQDDLNLNLDMNTFRMERSSHSYNLVTNDRTLTWQFMNVNLPDSNSNEPLSHGFVEFSILSVQGLPDGSQIDNHAAIYFDFNQPVITNSVTNTLQTIITSAGEKEIENNISVYPVPFSNDLTIEVFNNSSIFQIALYNILGREIKHLFIGKYYSGDKIKLNTLDVAPGIYVMKISYATGEQNFKLLKQ